jgi:hypothetical protein
MANIAEDGYGEPLLDGLDYAAIGLMWDHKTEVVEPNPFALAYVPQAAHHGFHCLAEDPAALHLDIAGVPQGYG